MVQALDCHRWFGTVVVGTRRRSAGQHSMRFAAAAGCTALECRTHVSEAAEHSRSGSIDLQVQPEDTVLRCLRHIHKAVIDNGDGVAAVVVVGGAAACLSRYPYRLRTRWHSTQRIAQRSKCRSSRIGSPSSTPPSK